MNIVVRTGLGLRRDYVVYSHRHLVEPLSPYRPAHNLVFVTDFWFEWKGPRR